MKKYNVRITDTRPVVSVGDKVQFTLNGTTYVDVVTSISGSRIEGMLYELTTMNLIKVTD
jgi:hypothetical protein